MVDIVYEEVFARGHPNIRAIHKTTLEITRDQDLTPRGDCIIGVKASKGLADFSKEFKEIARKKTSIIITLLYIDDKLYDQVIGHGHPSLTYSDNRKIIIRKSTYIDGATAMINSSKAARDLDRELVGKLRDSDTVLKTLFITLDLGELYSKNIPIGRIVKYLPYTSNSPINQTIRNSIDNIFRTTT